jgi:CheY-like chemotaxis protein
MPSMRILLAEDESIVARLISKVLMGKGDGVELVTSCHEAIERLRAAEFDLVMLDMHLDDGDGFQVVEAMEAGEAPASPVLLITGDYFEADDPRPGRVAGVLPKPFDLEQLERAVSAFRH